MRKKLLVHLLWMVLLLGLTLPAAAPVAAGSSYTVLVLSSGSSPPPDPLPGTPVVWSQTSPSGSGTYNTPFSLIADEGSLVTVTAPPFTWNGTDCFIFRQWLIFPIPQLFDQKTVTFPVGADKTVIAKYQQISGLSQINPVTPPDVFRNLGVTHIVWVNIGVPASGVEVKFVIQGANWTESGSASTNATGDAAFTYTGSVEGRDNVWAYIDGNRNGFFDPGEPCSPNSSVVWWAEDYIVMVGAVEDTGSPGITVPIDWSCSSPLGEGTQNTLFCLFVDDGGEITLVAPLTDNEDVKFYVFKNWLVGSLPGSPVIDTVNRTISFDTAITSGIGKRATARYHQIIDLGLISPLPMQVDPVGNEDSVWVNIGMPVAGVEVAFVIEGPNYLASGPRLTDTTGKATFTYLGAEDGIDNIWAYIDSNGNSQYDTGEPRSLNTVMKTWVENYITGGGNIKVDKKVVWTFEGEVGILAEGGVSGYFTIVNKVTGISYTLDQFQTLSFTGETTGSPAASHKIVRFRGTGTASDGSPITLVIMIEDNGEPGAGADRIAVVEVISTPPLPAPQITSPWIGNIFFPPPSPPSPPEMLTVSGGNFQIHDMR